MKLVHTTTLTLAILFLFHWNAQAGIKLLGVVEWSGHSKQLIATTGAEVTAPHFKEAVFNPDLSKLPIIVKKVPLSGRVSATVTLQNATYANANMSGFSNLTDIGEEIVIKQQIVYEKKEPILHIYLVPFKQDALTGRVQQLVDYTLDIEVNEVTTAKTSVSNYASNSVLNDGTWYKLGVSATGIHRIDYDLLVDLGLDPNTINPNNIHIYGNGGGMLPEANDVPRHDDLVENAIWVSGSSDGVFNNGDYILFYAQEAGAWVYNEPEGIFEYDMNVYSFQNYYFLTVDGTPGKRVGSNPNGSGATQTVTSFNDYRVHEVEEVNLIRSGKGWYGDYFNFGVTNRSFSFDFPNISTADPVTIRTEIAARSTSSATSMPVSVNGQTVHTHSMGTVSTNYTAIYANNSLKQSTYTPSASQQSVSISFTNGSSAAEAWLSFIELNARRNLVYNGGELQFRDVNSVGVGNVSEFVVQGLDASVVLWDVTDPVSVVAQEFNSSGGQGSFVVPTETLTEFVAFRTNSSFPEPAAIGQIENQDLHGIGQPDMIIITTAELSAEAQRLADHRSQKTGISVEVVNVEHVYNEFGSGRLDVSAIRNFMKMLYDRAGTDADLLPQYLLLMGDASYDFRNINGNNQNHIPTFQSDDVLSPVGTYCTDDYFGFLDDGEGANISSTITSQDISIGRLPVKDVNEARAVIDKIIHYESLQTLGNWRNNLSFVSDDEDGNLHFRDAEILMDMVEDDNPVYNVRKIHMDAYEQQSTPAGSRYPDVKDEINRSIFQGSLLMDYIGHGGTSGWAHERIIDLNDIRNWENLDKLPLMVTATCEFTRHDDPGKVSAGEEVILNPNGGAIGLVTTLRLVYASANMATNTRFLTAIFDTYDGDRMPTLGEAVMLAKNNLNNGALNARKFTLIGDPSMTLNYPTHDVVTTTINGVDVATSTDTLSALEEVTICGEVRDAAGNKLTGFNGFVYPTIYDKRITVETLANDAQSSKADFETLSSIIFKGKASVSNGEFCYTFIVPLDISYNFGTGKISYYAEDGMEDANGYTFDFVIGGTASGFTEDNEGPQVRVFMNDENFVSGGITDANPLLLAKLYDLHGINTAGNAVGHEITAIMDENTSNTLVLNDYYQSEADNYQNGEVLFPLSNLEEGLHRIKVKAWDVYNNSGEGFTEFVVTSSPKLALEHVLNYPNPFVNGTNFSFEHNKAGEQLFVEVKIYNMSGQRVSVLNAEVQPEGYRVNNIEWDGTNSEGAPLTKGVYLYRLEVSTVEGETAHQVERLVIIR